MVLRIKSYFDRYCPTCGGCGLEDVDGVMTECWSCNGVRARSLYDVRKEQKERKERREKSYKDAQRA